MQLDRRWAALPTVTATAKPAVSPVADKIRAGVPPATFAPSVVDGGREVARPGLIALLEAAVGACEGDHARDKAWLVVSNIRLPAMRVSRLTKHSACPAFAHSGMADDIASVIDRQSTLRRA